MTLVHPEDDSDDIAVLPATDERNRPEEATPVDVWDVREEDVDIDIDREETEDVGSADPITSNTPTSG